MIFSFKGKVCAKERKTCGCDGKVKFGVDDKWTAEKDVDGSIECIKENFERDPAPGWEKECRCTAKSE